jgi:hypothetical protein
VLDELVDLGNELRDAGEGAAADRALRDERKTKAVKLLCTNTRP